MNVTELYSGSASISTTEYSLPLASTTGLPANKTDNGAIQVYLDLDNLANGDVYELRLYEKVRSADSAKKFAIFYLADDYGADNAVWVSPCFYVKHGWDVTLKRTAGADRTIAWSIRTA